MAERSAADTVMVHRRIHENGTVHSSIKAVIKQLILRQHFFRRFKIQAVLLCQRDTVQTVCAEQRQLRTVQRTDLGKLGRRKVDHCAAHLRHDAFFQRFACLVGKRAHIHRGQIGVVPIHFDGQRLDRFGFDPVVAVQKNNVFALRCVQRSIARRAQTAVFLVQHAHAAVRLRIAVADLCAPVGRSVVHKQYVQIGISLRKDRIHAFFQIRLHIVDRYSHSDFLHDSFLLVPQTQLTTLRPISFPDPLFQVASDWYACRHRASPAPPFRGCGQSTPPACRRSIRTHTAEYPFLSSYIRPN